MWTRCNVTTLMVTIAAAMLVLSVSVARAATEQIVFSGKSEAQSVGFWVWCQNGPGSPNANYETDCNGALYFYDLNVVAHVTGDVHEPSDGTYVMVLFNSDDSVTCSLTNTPPVVMGPHNTVTTSFCTANGTDTSGRTVTNAVVNATGPD